VLGCSRNVWNVLGGFMFLEEAVEGPSLFYEFVGICRRAVIL
jgi:hypothetical protein